MEQTPLVAGVMQIEQEVLHLHSPLLMLLLADVRTIAHEVCSTDAMSTVIGIIARQSVVHASRGFARPDADLVLGAVLSAVGPTRLSVTGKVLPNLTAYHATFLAAAVLALIAAGMALAFSDRDAAPSMQRQARPSEDEDASEQTMFAEAGF